MEVAKGTPSAQEESRLSFSLQEHAIKATYGMKGRNLSPGCLQLKSPQTKHREARLPPCPSLGCVLGAYQMELARFVQEFMVQINGGAVTYRHLQ